MLVKQKKQVLTSICKLNRIWKTAKTSFHVLTLHVKTYRNMYLQMVQPANTCKIHANTITTLIPAIVKNCNNMFLLCCPDTHTETTTCFHKWVRTCICKHLLVFTGVRTCYLPADTCMWRWPPNVRTRKYLFSRVSGTILDRKNMQKHLYPNMQIHRSTCIQTWHNLQKQVHALQKLVCTSKNIWYWFVFACSYLQKLVYAFFYPAAPTPPPAPISTPNLHA